MATARRRQRAADYAWPHVRRLSAAHALTFLALCRILDTDGIRRPVEPPTVAAVTGKSTPTTARDLHALSERGLIARTLIRVDGTHHVAYTLPVEVLASIVGIDLR